MNWFIRSFSVTVLLMASLNRMDAQLIDSTLTVFPGKTKASYSVEELKKFKYFQTSDGRNIRTLEIMCKLNGLATILNSTVNRVRGTLPGEILKKLKKIQPGEYLDFTLVCGPESSEKKYQVWIKVE